MIPEIEELLEIQQINHPMVRFEVLETITSKTNSLPIHGITVGNPDKHAPTFALIGGVHGLERIGSQIIISFLRSLVHQLSWDQVLLENFKKYRLVCLPILNPGGMEANSRCNLNHVDLMRNAPIEAIGKTLPLISGHRISEKLPWFRGHEGVLETESKVLIKFVREEILLSKYSIVLDIHSGFGVKDRIWYPFAKSNELFPYIKQIHDLKKLLDQTYPYHVYQLESQSVNYLTHGDLWDYLFEIHMKENSFRDSTFLPLTLELGSWNWVKKNPFQFFSKLGIFHPMKKHRHSRTMRRHINLLDFLMRAVNNYEKWSTNS